MDFHCWLASLSQFQQFGCWVVFGYHSFLYWTIVKARSACWIMDCPPLLKERPGGYLLLPLSWPLPPHLLILPMGFKLFGSLEGLFSIHRLTDLSVPSVPHHKIWRTSTTISWLLLSHLLIKAEANTEDDIQVYFFHYDFSFTQIRSLWVVIAALDIFLLKHSHGQANSAAVYNTLIPFFILRDYLIYYKL